jgi:NSS family neurotransmitter:Na+ symporter
MDETRKWTLYLTFLVAGFATGIGSIGLFPQFWLEYGMTGLIIHIALLALFGYLAILETETVMKSGYYFVELFQKVLKRPAMVLTFLTVIALFLSYYTANVMLSLLSPVLGTGTVGRY